MFSLYHKNQKINNLNNFGEKLFYTFMFDNGPDYPQEGLFRIISLDGNIGYADLQGNILIAPIYKFAFPFKDGKAKVASVGHLVEDNEYIRWKSNKWYYILNPLNKSDEE